MNLACKFMTGLGLMLVILCVLIAGQRNEARRQRDAALLELAALMTDNTVLRTNIAAMQAGIDIQNRALDRLHADAQARQQAGADALRLAQQTTRELGEQNRVLRTIIQTTHPETCDATFDAARAGL